MATPTTRVVRYPTSPHGGCVCSTGTTPWAVPCSCPPGLPTTCAHVVNAALGLDGGGEEHPGALATVRLESFDGREREAAVDTRLWSAGPDSRDPSVLRLRLRLREPSSSPIAPSGTEVEFGVNATAEAGAVVVEGSAEAAFNVRTTRSDKG
ncbi:CU044_2847 family protein [Nocardiopsis akebiae]|uniref:CU044_2847 family protein n=1 Tax=Nocardiopsis akebiae TaxID=2831968 RepID=UPI0020167D13|nr:CU044_2847 family protein [Nocardiopsis akebiae]